MILRSEHGTIVHTGDWNHDVNPLDGDKLDRSAFEDVGAYKCLGAWGCCTRPQS